MPSTTPKSEYSELVESDKRSIIEKVMRNTNLLEHCSGVFKSQPLNMKDRNENIPTYSIKSMKEEVDWLLADDGDDDIDEVWNKILRDAEKGFTQEQLFKEKHPYLESCFEESTPKPVRTKTRKRKPIFETNTRHLIDSFKKDLTAAKSTEMNFTETSSSVSHIAQMKKQKKDKTVTSRFFKCKLTRDDPVPNTGFPKWNTTATGTPIFDMPYNPNWVNMNKKDGSENDETTSQVSQTSSKLNFQKLTSSSSHKKSTSTEETKVQQEETSKFYTPGQIKNWIRVDKSTDEMAQSSCKSFRSDAATCHSTDFDNASIVSYTDFESSPTRNTTVRFRASPPQCVLYSPRASSMISKDSYQNTNHENGGSFDFQFSSSLEYNPNIQYDNQSILSSDLDLQRSEYMEDYPEYTDKGNIPSPKFLSKKSFEENFARQLEARIMGVEGSRNMEIETYVKMKCFF